MEVKIADAKHALEILENEYLRSTGLTSYDLNASDALFDESAVTSVCPACGTSFIPSETSTCPECELSFGR